MKVLLEKHADNPTIVQRFVEEAQIGGQLQHPGIVPVHGLGLLADERPYFTMKLVKGRTLAAPLADREDTRAEHHRFLTIFEQICQTLANAHARRVIHRDLKPPTSWWARSARCRWWTGAWPRCCRKATCATRTRS